MANQFYVDPTGGYDVGAGLRGLGNTLLQADQIKRQKAQDAQAQEQQERLKTGKLAVQDAFKSNNPDQIASTMIEYPELANTFNQAMKFKSDTTKDNFAQSAREVVLNPSNTEQILTNRIEMVTAEGGDASESMAALEEYRENPQEFLQSATNVFAAYDPTGFKSYKEAQSGGGDIKVGRFQYKDTPDGFLKVDSATGNEEVITVGSKAYKTIQDRKIAEIDKELELEGKIFDKSKKVRDRYDTKAKEFIAVRNAYDRIEASIDEPDAAGDIALIFNYMKMLDPGSVVREGEFATAQNAGGIDDSVRNMYNKLTEGERLQPKQREMFANRAKKLFKKAEFANQKDRAETLNIGKRYGLTEADIFGDGSIYPAGDNAGVTIETNVADMSDDDLMKELEGR